MGYTIGGVFSDDFYGGGGASLLANVGVFPVALGGHGYMINWQSERPLVWDTVEVLRQQSDDSNEPGEATVNPEGLWRRGRSSWHLGSGQEHLDREDSEPNRFHLSQGVDPWEKNKLTLLNDTTEKVNSANTNLLLAVAGTHLYFCNGTTLGYYTDIVAGGITNVTGVPAGPPSSIASDGFNVITAHGANGIYKTTRGAATTAQHFTTGINASAVLGFARGRFLLGTTNNVYDITAGTVGGVVGALPVALFTHGNTDFRWVGFAEGFGAIFMAGVSGDKSLIYRTAVKQDGTALDAPTVAAELPDGEIVTGIYGYLGRFVAIGTNKGWRLAVVNGSGELSLGVLITTPQSVQCFEGQGPYIWYGLSGFSATSTGLGRMSTEFFADPSSLQPAYASDLMVTGTGAVLSVVTFGGRRVFTVSADGLYYENDNCVSEGYFTTGKISFGIAENKIGFWIDLQHQTAVGQFEVLISLDGGPFVSIGVQSGAILPNLTYSLGEADASTFDIKVIIRRDTTPTLCPTLLSWLFRVQPRAKMTKYIYATIYLAPEMYNEVEGVTGFDVYEELSFVEGLHESKVPTTWQQGSRGWTVVLDDFTAPFHDLLDHGQGYDDSANLDIQLKMKRIE